MNEQPVLAAQDVLWGRAGCARGEVAGQQEFSLQLTVALQDHALQHGPVPASRYVAVKLF